MLEGSNYAYWKASMRAFIKSIGKRAWRTIFISWEPPFSIVKDVSSPKLEITCTTKKNKAANYNYQALNAIFNRVDPQGSKRISKNISTCEAWTILETTHEGIFIVK